MNVNRQSNAGLWTCAGAGYILRMQEALCSKKSELTPMTSWALPIVCLFFLAGCWGGSEEASEDKVELSDEHQEIVGQFDSAREKEEAEKANPGSGEWVGVWVIGDTPEQSFDLVVLPDGKAITNWVEGDNGIRGEFGRWELAKDGILLTYDSGWRDLILKDENDNYSKKSFAPGLPIDGTPNNVSGVEAHFGPGLPFIGVWQGNDYDGKPLFYMALTSDKKGRKSNNPNAYAEWVVQENVARIVWTDDSYNELVPAGRTEAILRVWRKETPRDGKPDAEFKIGMVQTPAAKDGGETSPPDSF